MYINLSSFPSTPAYHQPNYLFFNNNTINPRPPNMQLTTLLFSAVAMLAATVAANPAPAPDAQALSLGAEYSPLHKRYCCKDKPCNYANAPDCYVSRRRRAAEAQEVHY
jgi:hypothetical protein